MLISPTVVVRPFLLLSGGVDAGASKEATMEELKAQYRKLVSRRIAQQHDGNRFALKTRFAGEVCTYHCQRFGSLT
jgi:hypothetical protein